MIPYMIKWYNINNIHVEDNSHWKKKYNTQTVNRGIFVNEWEDECEWTPFHRIQILIYGIIRLYLPFALCQLGGVIY